MFAKLTAPPEAAAELAGQALLRGHGFRTPEPIAVPDAGLLLFEALDERAERDDDDWAEIGTTLARLHEVRGEEFGLATATRSRTTG